MTALDVLDRNLYSSAAKDQEMLVGANRTSRKPSSCPADERARLRERRRDAG